MTGSLHGIWTVVSMESLSILTLLESIFTCSQKALGLLVGLRLSDYSTFCWTCTYSLFFEMTNGCVWYLLNIK